MSGGAEHGIARFLHDIVKVADLSPSEKKGLLRNGLANRRAWIYGRDADTGTPSDAFVARPSPFSEIPVKHPVDDKGTPGAQPGSSFAAANPSLVATGARPQGIATTERQAGATSERLSLGATVVHVERVQEPERLLYPTHDLKNPQDTKNLSTPIVQVERAGAEHGEIKSSAPASDLLRVLDGVGCLLGNDSAETAPFDRGRPVAGGMNIAWAATLPGRGVSIRTRGGDALAPMKRGNGSPFQEPTGGERGDGLSTVARGGGSGGAGGAGGSGAGGGGGGDLAVGVERLARDPSGAIRAYDAQGRVVDGIVFYRDSSGNNRWVDTRDGRTGSVGNVINVAPVGYHGTGSLYDGIINPDGTITVGLPGPTTGVQVTQPSSEIRFAQPVTFRDRGGAQRQAVGIRQTGPGKFELFDDTGAAFIADITQDSEGNVFVTDPTTGRGQNLGNVYGIVGLGLGGGMQTQIDPRTGERTIVVGITGGTLRASINGIVYQPGDPGYGALVRAADQQANALKEREFAGQGSGPGGTLSDGEREQLAAALDIGYDSQQGRLLGTTTAERHARESGDAAAAAAAALAARPPQTGLLLEALFGPYNDVGYPLAFNRPLSEKVHDLTAVGKRWGAGYLMEIGGFWHVVVPIPETVPKKGDPPGGGDPPPPPPPPPPPKKTGPPSDDGEEPIGGKMVPRGTPWGPDGGREKVGGDGELTPCDRGEFYPEPIGGGGGGGGENATPGRIGGGDEAATLLVKTATLLSRAPGTSGARSHPGAGKTVIQPQLPPMNPSGDERQRLGGGAYMRGAPLVPRGGIRLLDSLDFTPDHTVWDVINKLIDDRNALASLLNERFPFAPDAVKGAGLGLPAQPPDKVRLEQFDPGTVLHVAVKHLKGRIIAVPHMVYRERDGKKALRPIGGDLLPERTLGLGDTSEDILLRFDTGSGAKSDKTDLPTIGYEQTKKALVVKNAPMQLETNLTIVGDDGSTTKIDTVKTTGATTFKRKPIGAAEVTTTMDARDGKVVLAPSALTLGLAPKADANGDLVPSNLMDPGAGTYGDVYSYDPHSALWTKTHNAFANPDTTYEFRSAAGEVECFPWISAGSGGTVSDLVDMRGVSLLATGGVATEGRKRMYYADNAGALRKVVGQVHAECPYKIISFRAYISTLGGAGNAAYAFGFSDLAWTSYAAGPTACNDGTFFYVDPTLYGNANVHFVGRASGSTTFDLDLGSKFNDAWYTFAVVVDFTRGHIPLVDGEEVASPQTTSDFGAAAPVFSVMTQDNGSSAEAYVSHATMRLPPPT